ncbi:MAG: ribonuclease J [Alphaproteobacteria bacterium]|nr:ribonuclease J [Alphaproteobacteria bacterium]
MPLGGTGEIGMNMNLYGYGEMKANGKPDYANFDWLMVDAGITFGGPSEPGIEIILPDIEFIMKYRKRLLGLVLTHAHQDHIGAVAHLWPYLRCPIYATAFTAELVQEKLERAHLADEAPLHVLPLSSHIDLGVFQIDFISLTHSIIEPCALAIRTPIGNVLHTGDWKIDPAPQIGELTDQTALKEFGKEGVDAIVCDSTNVLLAGVSGSEKEAADGLHQAVAACKKRAVVTLFSSNVARLHAIGQVAKATGRQISIAGFGIYRIYCAARKTGYLQDFPEIIPETEAVNLPPDELLLLCTGSQGEPRATLSRLARGTYPHFELEAGDTVIFSARTVPGNELKIFDLQNRLAEQDIHVVTTNDHFLHVSGHPNRDEVAQMYEWAKPRIAVPVHGEYRHLRAHALLAEKLGVEQAIRASNGDVVQLIIGADKGTNKGMGEIIDTVPYGRLYIDGDIFVSAVDYLMDERRKLSSTGVVSIALAIDEAGQLCGEPEITSMGIPEHDDYGVELENWIVEAIDHALPQDKIIMRCEVASEQISAEVQRAMRHKWGKKPEIMVNFVRV